MDRPRMEVTTDRLLYTPGETVTGSLRVIASKPVNADQIIAKLRGTANVYFQEYDKTHTYTSEKVLVDERQELWRFVRLGELLDLPLEDDYMFSGFYEGTSNFPFKFRLPYDLATSFHSANCPVTIKYSILFEILLFEDVHYSIEHNLPVVVPNKIPRSVANKKVNHTRMFTFTKGRSIVVECSIEKGVFTPVEKVPIELRIYNKWKQSIKYCHVNVVRRVEYEGVLDNYQEVKMRKTFNHDYTGVGLPTVMPKVPVGDSFSFRPDINLPALTPNMEIENLMKLDYFIKISVGRSHSLVVAEMLIPITIVTDIVDVDAIGEPVKQTTSEELLIDLNAAACSPYWSHNQFVDLLA